MKFPYLGVWDNAVCKAFLTKTEPSEDGDFPVVSTYEGGCNLSEKATIIRTIEGEHIKLSCVLHIKGDIAPELPVFSGNVEINGNRMKIETVDRPRNPDGTVHHTRLGLI
jgi:hypothetical protein